MAVDIIQLIEKIRRQQYFDNQIVHIEKLPARPPRYCELSGGLHESMQKALSQQGIHSFYSHQATAIENVRNGKHVVIVTSTASGKTLCYSAPVIESIIRDSLSTALFMYPTKALAQDQLRNLSIFQTESSGIQFLAGTYDGDTPANLRRKLRDGANIILTNPDMLHQGILPQHARWNRFFTHLRFIVIDEVHAYRGIFGSHLANVVRRLSRICRHYGAAPQFICSSATIANPKDHAERICGRAMELVDNDGSPRGPKLFVFWNPPPLKTLASGDADNWRIGGDRRSPVGEAVHLLSALVKEGVQTIAFVRTRLAAELIYKSCRDILRGVSRKLADSVHAYRGGYLPEQRREIERKLASKEILGVASTNALELGIDIGSLDACILVGYPGTIASLWQQSGRAGRGREESLVFLLGNNSPIDQYLMAHSAYVFAQNPENAVVDPDNPHISVGHIKCASAELPLSEDDAAQFGAYAPAVLELLEEDDTVRHIENNYYWARREYPAAEVNLRNISGPVYTIQDAREGDKVIGTMDEISALSQLHTHAVYIHGAETYFVDSLSLDQKVAYVKKQDLDYYTQAVQMSDIRLDEKEQEQTWQGSILGYGDVTVTTSLPMFKKIRFHSRDSLGYEKLEMPPQTLETVALWFVPPQSLAAQLTEKGLLIGEALVGIANVFIEVAPLYVMCDVQDIGTVIDSRNLGCDAMFVHDRYPGGMGYARRCADSFGDIMHTVADVIAGCGCSDGCPSCVGAALPAFALSDLDSSVRGRIPNKEAARLLLGGLFNA
jgi:DEAD/DEAH box helicase domain-containing protein